MAFPSVPPDSIHHQDWSKLTLKYFLTLSTSLHGLDQLPTSLISVFLLLLFTTKSSDSSLEICHCSLLNLLLNYPTLRTRSQSLHINSEGQDLSLAPIPLIFLVFEHNKKHIVSNSRPLHLLLPLSALFVSLTNGSFLFNGEILLIFLPNRTQVMCSYLSLFHRTMSFPGAASTLALVGGMLVSD